MPRVVSLILVAGLVACGDGSPRPDGIIFPDFTPPDVIQRPDAPGLPDIGNPGSTDRCGGGVLLAFNFDGVATFNGSTAGATNEFGNGVHCGSPATPLAGPQRYHRIALERNKTYRFTLSPTFDGVMYLATSCDLDQLNAQCQSAGAVGTISAVVPAGQSGEMVFTPDTNAVFRVMVDSYQPTEAGDYGLVIDRFDVPSNVICTSAEPIPGPLPITLSSNTFGAADDNQGIVCNLGQPLLGRQRYFSVSLEQDKVYRIGLASDYLSALVLFRGVIGCQQTAMNTDCGGMLGTVIPYVFPGVPEEIYFKAPITDDFVIAVDSFDPVNTGNFQLTVAEEQPQAGALCDDPEPLVLTSPVTSVMGTTQGGLSHTGASVACAGKQLFGPQHYYLTNLDPGSYFIELAPTFDGVVGISTGCVDFQVQCNAPSGASAFVPQGTTGGFFFDVATQADYRIVVDSPSSGEAGMYGLRVINATTASSDCTQPTPLTPVAGSVTVAGQTGFLNNSYPDISCGNPAGPWNGPEAFYSLSLAAGQTATITLTPEASFDGALYAFASGTTCDQPSIDAACAGQSADFAGDGAPDILVLNAASPTTYVIAVDSFSPSEVGRYTLTVDVQ